MSDASFVERRHAGRQRINRHVTLLIESDRTNAHREAVTVDLGTLGARVRSDAPLLPGQSIDLIIKEGITHIVPAEVIWVNGAHANTPRDAGLKFTDPDGVPCAVLSPGLNDAK